MTAIQLFHNKIATVTDSHRIHIRNVHVYDCKSNYIGISMVYLYTSSHMYEFDPICVACLLDVSGHCQDVASMNRHDIDYLQNTFECHTKKNKKKCVLIMPFPMFTRMVCLRKWYDSCCVPCKTNCLCKTAVDVHSTCTTIFVCGIVNKRRC